MGKMGNHFGLKMEFAIASHVSQVFYVCQAKLPASYKEPLFTRSLCTGSTVYLITLPRPETLLLMAAPSDSVDPVAPVLLARSLPAMSMMRMRLLRFTRFPSTFRKY
jgi:hypothetical protein